MTLIYILAQFSKTITILVLSHDKKLFNTVSMYIANFMYFNAVVNLPVYVIMIQDFRKGVFSLIGCIPNSVSVS